jgi:hypothetical protein
LDSKDIKLKIIEAGYKAVEQLIKVSKEAIIKHDPEDDIFEILNRIEAEKEALESLKNGPKKTDTKQGFAERRSK